MTSVRNFQVDQALVTGVTLLEASAGTGKTYQIANLVLRLVAEGIADIREIVVVTFTNAATAELKDRIRKRLIHGYQRLSIPGREDEEDPLFVVYNRLSEQDRQCYLERLHTALERFDEASISTIHGFCQRLLQNNAFESGADFGMELIKDESTLLEQLVDDFLVNSLYAAGKEEYQFLVNEAGYTRETLLKLAKNATEDLDMTVIPNPVKGDRSSQELEDSLQRFREAWASLDRSLLKGFERDYPVNKSGKAKDTLGYVHLSGRSFREDKTLSCLEELETWVAQECIHPNPSASFFGHFALHRLREAARSPLGEALAHAPAFEALAAVHLACQKASTTQVESARLNFVHWIRSAYDGAHRTQGTQGYNALVRQLALQLNDDQRRPHLVRALRQTFKVGLIDEFQDTDGAQWDIFRQIFVPNGRDQIPNGYLYLIGDPKQAIYGFRGANIHVYLNAKSEAGPDRVFTLTTNYRSDQKYISALNYLMDRPNFFGDPGIPYIPVDAAHDRGGLQLQDGSPYAALQIRLFDQRCLSSNNSNDAGPITNQEAQDVLPHVVASDIHRLLQEGVLPTDTGKLRRIRCSDIAILVYSGYQARDVRTAMDAWGLPAVLASAGSVFETEEAESILRWLHALEHPRREGPARVAAVSQLFGWTGDDLHRLQNGDVDTQRRWDLWVDHIQDWSNRARHKGFMSAFRILLEYERLGESIQKHILNRPKGERIMTNLRHLAELLHTVETNERLSIGGLARWLEDQRVDPDEHYSDASQIRLESDAEAIRIVTMHASKGLQYPIVFLPYLWRGRGLDKTSKSFLKVSNPEEPDRRLLALQWDVGPQSDKAPLIQRAERNAHEEVLRLLYVAMTRAQFSTTVYWGGRVRCGHSASHRPELAPLASVLHGSPSSEDLEDRIQRGVHTVLNADHEAIFDEVFALANGHSDTIEASVCVPPKIVRWSENVSSDSPLQPRLFERDGLDTTWGRWSYSTITDGKHSHRQEAPEGQDRSDSDDDGQSPDLGLEQVQAVSKAVPFAFFPSGADAGTCLHEILEVLDFERAIAPTGTREYEDSLSTVREILVSHGFGDKDFEQETFDALRTALITPLGGPLAQHTLSQISRSDRLDEMSFDFPLSSQVRTQETQAIQKHHWISVFERYGGDSFSEAYQRALRQLDFQPISGFMTGFIDLIFRVQQDGEDRYFVADYKSNRIAPWGIQPTDAHFSQAALQREMEAHHYFIQSHLYTVALHRFLKWRLPDYEYTRHIGGAYYLFLRGMTGPIEGDRSMNMPGVHFHCPDQTLIEALDDCLGGGTW